MMSESRNPQFEVMHDGNGELVFNSSLIRPIINFLQCIFGAIGPDLTPKKTIKILCKSQFLINRLHCPSFTN